MCPGGLQCQQQEVNCKTDPCPPVPTCKKARSLSDLCPGKIKFFAEKSSQTILTIQHITHN